MQIALEDIIGSKNKIKLLRFLSNNRDWQFNLAEISKKIGLDKGALSRLVKELEAKGVLEVKRSGKLVLFKINEDNKAISEQVIPLFSKEAKK